ncbi:helix-turn-helix transcriptional regulator [Kribbella sp. NPDC056951]|uniref:helix-turn-helix transcriptional regulator n=1 Tax=Kribbella sp. NPDC056951 TaxID=3345978 RepID=UPI00362CD4C9
MRAERLLRLLLHLQTRGRSTVADLAAVLDVSHRTVQRDLDALSLAGVPVYSTRGRGGGWSLLPDYRSRLTGLTPSEVMSVFVGATAHVLADLGLDVSADQAVLKLIATLPDASRRDAEYARQRLLIDHAGWDDRGSVTSFRPRWLDLCRQAVWEERTLEITYAEGTTPFPIAPLGLVAKTRTWYLVAARPAGHLRTYRLSRLTAATLLSTTFTRPPDFDLATYWHQAQQALKASRPSYLIVLRVHEDSLRRFRPTTPPIPAGNGWWIIHADLENPAEATATVLAQAGTAIALSPPALVTAVREAAQSLTTLHPD